MLPQEHEDEGRGRKKSTAPEVIMSKERAEAIQQMLANRAEAFQGMLGNFSEIPPQGISVEEIQGMLENRADEALEGMLENLSEIPPQGIRPFPPMLPVQFHEPIWIGVEDSHEILWDSMMLSILMTKDLMSKALKEALSPSQHEDLLRELKNNPRLVKLSGLSPEMLPDLVENNPKIAIEVLRNGLEEYYAQLEGMEINRGSLEVIYRLKVIYSTKGGLPNELLHSFKERCRSSYGKFMDFLLGKPDIEADDCITLIEACKEFFPSKIAKNKLCSMLNKELTKQLTKGLTKESTKFKH